MPISQTAPPQTDAMAGCTPHKGVNAANQERDIAFDQLPAGSAAQPEPDTHPELSHVSSLPLEVWLAALKQLKEVQEIKRKRKQARQKLKRKISDAKLAFLAEMNALHPKQNITVDQLVAGSVEQLQKDDHAQSHPTLEQAPLLVQKSLSVLQKMDDILELLRKRELAACQQANWPASDAMTGCGTGSTSDSGAQQAPEMSSKGILKNLKQWMKRFERAKKKNNYKQSMHFLKEMQSALILQEIMMNRSNPETLRGMKADSLPFAEYGVVLDTRRCRLCETQANGQPCESIACKSRTTQQTRTMRTFNKPIVMQRTWRMPRIFL